MQLSFIIPTRDRNDQLEQTLSRLGDLGGGLGEQAELIVCDNASKRPMQLPEVLPNGIAVTSIRLDRNHNTAARNIGAQQACGSWLVMLADDSPPMEAGLIETLGAIDPQVVAVGGEIMLTNGSRESGGLPEVIVGCGCAIRRDAFLSVGGYDASFGYYAEEYDLCAKLIASGHRVVHSRGLRFEHRKSTQGRDFNEIIYRLVRNNGWVLQRYAPHDRREILIEETVARYRRIAEIERAQAGFERGLGELRKTLGEQPDLALTEAQWERFEGRAAVRATIEANLPMSGMPVRLVGPAQGKGRSIIEGELLARGCTISDDPDTRPFIATLSPGPMLDALDAHPDAMMPWSLSDRVGHARAAVP